MQRRALETPAAIRKTASEKRCAYESGAQAQSRAAAIGCPAASVTVYAAALTRRVGITGAVAIRAVRPFALQLPLRPVRKGHARHIERPRALVSVLRARALIPGTRIGGVGACLRPLVGRANCQPWQAFRSANWRHLRFPTRVPPRIPTHR